MVVAVPVAVLEEEESMTLCMDSDMVTETQVEGVHGNEKDQTSLPSLPHTLSLTVECY